jgi:small-conductance mechanosensitive channel
VTSDLNRAINAAFIEKGIEIPFPQRDVNFRGPLQVETGTGGYPVHPGDEPSQKS